MLETVEMLPDEPRPVVDDRRSKTNKIPWSQQMMIRCWKTCEESVPVRLDEEVLTVLGEAALMV